MGFGARGWAALVLVVLSPGCFRSGTQPPPAAPHPGAQPGPAPVAALPAAGAPAASSAAVQTEPAQPASPWALGLPLGSLPHAPEPDLWQYTRWKQKRSIRVGKSHLITSRLSPDDRHVLVVSSAEMAVRIYELKSGKLAWRHAIAGAERYGRVDATFWPDLSQGLRYIVAGKQGLTLHDAATGAELGRLWDKEVWSVGWSPDERVLIATCSQVPAQTSQVVFMERLPDHSVRLIREISTPVRVDGWALSADNQLLATITYPEDQVHLRRLDTGQLMWSIKAPMYAGDVAISADGKWVAAGGDHLLLIDAQSADVRAPYWDFQNNINTVVFSRAGDVVIASSYDGRIRILRNDLRDPHLTMIQEFRHGGQANVYQLSLLRDGSGMVSSSGDQTVRWWGI